MSSAAAWLLCKLCSTTTSGECKINEEAHRLGEPEGRTRKVYESGTCAPLNKSLLPTRACLNQRRALVPCVGQTISTNEWQQQSGGMILRRGSVVAAFLLCFLAKVRGLVHFFRWKQAGKVTRFGPFGCPLLSACVSPLKVHSYANITCRHASARKISTVSMLRA